MQTLSEIRAILEEAGLKPTKRFGQNFLFDKNLMAQIVQLAEVTGEQVVLEVGPGTGSLTEELLARAARVVAVEIDRGLGDVLERRLGDNDRFTLIRGDVLESKHAIAPQVHAALAPRATMVANLPYNVATPLVAQCLIDSWRAQAPGGPGGLCRFERLTFTVQREVAERFAARVGSDAYGPISIYAALLGHVRLGPVLPASAFWPRPDVASQVVRIDFDGKAAAAIPNIDTLLAVVTLSFAQRRKQIGSIIRRRESPFVPQNLADAMAAAGIDPQQRAEQVTPDSFAAMARSLGAVS